MGFGCECGYAWKGTLPETRDHEGEYLSLVELEQWEREVVGAIGSFLRALASGERDRWFDESTYFNHHYPRDLPDEEVIGDLLTATRLPRGVCVYRCPQCLQVYIQEHGDSNRWMKYEYVESIGTA
jgi:hypothetical protein